VNGSTTLTHDPTTDASEGDVRLVRRRSGKKLDTFSSSSGYETGGRRASSQPERRDVLVFSQLGKARIPLAAKCIMHAVPLGESIREP
jgi:hypothetical protein